MKSKDQLASEVIQKWRGFWHQQRTLCLHRPANSISQSSVPVLSPGVTDSCHSGSGLFIWRCLATDIRTEAAWWEEEWNLLKRRLAEPKQAGASAGPLDGTGENGARVRGWGSSPRGTAGFYSYSCIRTCCVTWGKGWVPSTCFLQP